MIRPDRMLERLPIESSQQVRLFATVRLALTLASAVVVLVLGLPYEGKLLAVVAGLGIPWSVGLLVVARRNPDLVLNPAVAVGDFALLVAIEVVVPEAYGAVRFAALFLIAVHAHFQGERRGVAIAGLGAVALVVATAIRGDTPQGGDLLAFWEAVFVMLALATGLLVGRLRTAESASRLSARRLSRHTIRSESEVRRQVAEAIHDGPVQELIGLDMMLSAANQAVQRGDGERATSLIGDARELTERNIHVLRDEILDLGPYAFEELTFAIAVQNCLPLWKRRYGFEVLATIEAVDLAPATAGDLFRITQEAVMNAARHSGAETVSLSLRRVGHEIELRIADNGRGFQDNDHGRLQPGHLGLAGMRERAELLDGRLSIESSARGTKVIVCAPLDQRRG
jgi:signal transduction histidine kinase